MNKPKKSELKKENDLWFWTIQQKLAYKAGELTKTQIKKLESLKNWSWNISEKDKKVFDIENDSRYLLYSLKEILNDDEHISANEAMSLICYQIATKGNDSNTESDKESERIFNILKEHLN